MGNIFKEDFIDFIDALNICDLRYMLIGGLSVVLHGYSRTTGDMDIWVDRTSENYKKIKLAFREWYIPMGRLRIWNGVCASSASLITQETLSILARISPVAMLN
ncbi:hypothetical protein [Mucilaginibacter gilvus]|uniref:Nucleotidyl transferase AbiEii/AbiGii toxin family protein n=1 Tax=Mucilaginibacter gilvus TaxID=2305909 RepID=A0A3S4Y7M3_9SPHI|nr:hypothetical protein [Mucilaginibacter gilvus]RWY49134.1 hypothetical protein EPL05_17075 [Mucilaginibacter gilvus]